MDAFDFLNQVEGAGLNRTELHTTENCQGHGCRETGDQSGRLEAKDWSAGSRDRLPEGGLNPGQSSPGVNLPGALRQISAQKGVDFLKRIMLVIAHPARSSR
jgi:hypothetical protein